MTTRLVSTTAPACHALRRFARRRPGSPWRCPKWIANTLLQSASSRVRRSVDGRSSAILQVLVLSTTGHVVGGDIPRGMSGSAPR